MTCGIYEIICMESGKTYVGSSKNIENRFYRHICELNRNTHKNKQLQNDWNKYGGESNFIFDIVKLVDKKFLKLEEEFFINDRSKFCQLYNINRVMCDKTLLRKSESKFWK
jgi:group I intron endonuclease